MNGDDAADGQSPVHVTVYVVTGKGSFFRIPEAFCRECNMFVNAAQSAADQVDTPVTVNIRSWWLRFPWALRHGGYHPPVMVIDGTQVAQGEDVPTTGEVVTAIRDAANTS